MGNLMGNSKYKYYSIFSNGPTIGGVGILIDGG